MVATQGFKLLLPALYQILQIYQGVLIHQPTLQKIGKKSM